MIPRFSSFTASYPSPSRSIVPGAMFSIVTSAFFSSSLTISRPRGDFKLRVTDFLLALNWWKYQGSSSGCPGRNLRPGSPVFGFSILTTSAPSQASASVHEGPASNCVKSTTRTPSRQSTSTPLPSISRHSSQCCRPTPPKPTLPPDPASRNWRVAKLRPSPIPPILPAPGKSLTEHFSLFLLVCKPYQPPPSHFFPETLP